MARSKIFADIHDEASSASAVVRVSFDGPTVDDMKFLMTEFGIVTGHDLLRFLVKQKAIEVRGNHLRYRRPPSPASPSKSDEDSAPVTSAAQNRLDKAKKIQEEMPLDKVTELLKNLGVVDTDGTYENGGGFRVSIALDSLGVKRERFEEYSFNNPDKPSISWGRTLADILAKCVRDRMI